MFFNKIRNRKLDNRGSAIIMVIIAMAFIGILVSMVMWMSTTNYMMKATDRKAKDNFYSSESVLEQILVGLQQDASEALTKAYTPVMQQYAELSAENRQNLFCTLYLDELKNRLNDGSADHYNMDHLIAYVDRGFFDGGYVNETALRNCSDHKMQVYKDHILLKDITVEFYDPATDYTSIITTDYCLDVPDIDFTQSSAMPDIFEFSLVANDTLKMNPTVKADIQGNIYGGENGINIGQRTDVKITKSKLIVTDSTISLNGIGTAENSANLTIGAAGDAPQVWADSVTVSGGNVALLGKTYLADDLCIEEKGGTAKLAGDYYGYGMSESVANESSAILINSKDATLDLSELDRIVLNGRSYIGTGRIAINNPTVPTSVSANDNVLMGESIAVKGNQIAYLVPSNCIGVLKTTSGEVKTLIGKNPMSGAEYTQMLAYQQQYQGSAEGDFEEVALDRSSSLIGTNLNYYGAGFKKVFVPVNGDTLVYYYLELSKEKAAQFFQDYYGMPYNKDKINKYFDFYVDKIITRDSLADYARIQINGNWLVGEEQVDGTNTYHLNTPNPSQEDLMNSESTKYAAMFSGYKTKLVPGYNLMSEEEKSKSVFENLILTNKLKNYTGAGGTKKFENAESSLTAVLSDSNITYPGGATDSNTRLIVTTGDVTINDDFSGLIIAGGKITVAKDVKIEPNRDDLCRVLQYTDSADNTIKPIGFFVKSSNYVLNGTSVSVNNAEDAGGVVDFREIVRYQNWEKK